MIVCPIHIEINPINSISAISVLIAKQIFEYIFSLLSEILHIVYNDTVNIWKNTVN